MQPSTFQWFALRPAAQQRSRDLTVEVVVLVTVRVSKAVQLSQQEGIFQDPLDRLDQV